MKVCPVRNDGGEALLSEHLEPLATRLGLSVEVVHGSDRFTSVLHQLSTDLMVVDCSVEPGHNYGALSEWVKHSERCLLLSRTPLPTNVHARYQCSPLHGQALSNADIGDWLERNLPRVVGREPVELNGCVAGSRIALSPHVNARRSEDLFVSFRGTATGEVLRVARLMDEAGVARARVVPQGQYAYEAECMSLQRMWEVVAELTHEMEIAKRAGLFLTDDYYDSFWTTSELLSLIQHRPKEEVHVVSDSYTIVVDGTEPRLDPLVLSSPGIPSAPLTSALSDRMWRILNNTDPATAAPDARVRPSGLTKALAFVLRHTIGHYDPEFTSEAWWEDLWVVCPRCRPVHRGADEVDWGRHLTFWHEDEGPGRYFGMFPVAPGALSGRSAEVSCPACGYPVGLRCDRPPRTYWAPVHSTEPDQDRPPIQELPLWEVEELAS